jgi:hypothetical protein
MPRLVISNETRSVSEERASTYRAMFKAPTRRELLLVIILFIALLTFSSRYISYNTVSPVDLSSVWNDVPPTPKIDGIPTLPSDTRLSWRTSKVPRTKIIAHVPGESVSFDIDINLLIIGSFQGWTIMDRMYIFNGTVFLVSDEPEIFPDRKYITSSGINVENSPELVAARLPTDNDMRIISTSTARSLFGTGANRVQGVAVRTFTSLIVACISQRL